MENNILNIVSDLSSKLGKENPELKDILKVFLGNEVKGEKNIEDYLVKKYPDKADEIRDAIKSEKVGEKLNKLKDIKSQLEGLCL